MYDAGYCQISTNQSVLACTSVKYAQTLRRIVGSHTKFSHCVACTVQLCGSCPVTVMCMYVHMYRWVHAELYKQH